MSQAPGDRNGGPGRRKQAEIASAVGAGVLGIGRGVLLSVYLAPYAIPILVVGALPHGWWMLDKRRLESDTAPAAVWWANSLYWIFWAALLILAVFNQAVSSPG